MHLIRTVVVPNFFFMQEISFANALLKFSFVVTGLLINVLIGTALIYISTLHTKINSINQ